MKQLLPFEAGARFPVILVCAISFGASCAFGAECGDRAPGTNCVYPEAAFVHAGKGGRVIDVTKPPYSAKGDGVADDTKALVGAYSFVADLVRKHGIHDTRASYIIYLPNGTYLVSDTIVYAGEQVDYTGVHPGYEGMAGTRFIGQSREKSIVKLKDNCPGFGQDANKPVFQYAKSKFNNAETKSTFRNITIDVGKGNPGAIGLDFNGANGNVVDNVAIVSRDGQGAIGLHSRVDPTQAYYSDILIDGFDYGVSVDPFHAHFQALEHITLRNQRVAGIRLISGCAAVRKLRFEGAVPAIQHTTPAAYSILLDSELSNGGRTFLSATGNGGRVFQPAKNAAKDSGGLENPPSVGAGGLENPPSVGAGGLGNPPSVAALDIQAGEFFARNVDVSGFAATIALAGKAVSKDAHIAEYSKSAPIAPYSAAPEKETSLNLPILDFPAFDWPADMTQWANVDDYGAVGDGQADDSVAVQKAFDSGKPVVCFPKRAYLIGKTISVPPTVRRVNMMYSSLKGADFAFAVNQDSDAPLLFEDGVDIPKLCSHEKPRTVCFRHIASSGALYHNSNASGEPTIFVTACNSFGKPNNPIVRLKAYCRLINTEFKLGPNYIVDNATLWVMGYKVESYRENYVVKNGGKLELFGGIANQTPWPKKVPAGEDHHPIIEVVDGSVSAILHTTGHKKQEKGYTNIVNNKQGKESKTLTWEALPKRTGGDQPHSFILPLYVCKRP